MEALQADIARRINKRRFTDTASDSESDSETSIEEHLRPAKRIRRTSKPTVPPIKPPSFLATVVRPSPPSSASSYTVVGDHKKGTHSSDTSRDISTTEKSSDESEEGNSQTVSSSTECLSKTGTSGSISSEEDNDDRSSRPLYADTETSIDSPTESSSSSDEDSDSVTTDRDVLEENGDPESSSDGSTSSESSSSSDRSISFPRLSSGAKSPQHIPNPLIPQTQAATTSRNLPGGATRNNTTDLRSRLNALLPQMQKANQELEIERQEGRLAERDIEQLGEEGEGYVEMNLGLGVLEEKGEVEEEDQADSEEEGEGGREREEGEGEDALPALVPTAGKGGGKVRIEVLEEGR